MKTCDADKDACVVLVSESSTSRRVWLRPRGSGGMDTFKVDDTIPVDRGWLQGTVGGKRWERCGVLDVMVRDSETERVLKKGIWENGEMRQQSRALAVLKGDLCSIPSMVAHNSL